MPKTSLHKSAILVTDSTEQSKRARDTRINCASRVDRWQILGLGFNIDQRGYRPILANATITDSFPKSAGADPRETVVAARNAITTDPSQKRPCRCYYGAKIVPQKTYVTTVQFRQMSRVNEFMTVSPSTS
jgi:hypothetical protein